MGKSVVALLAGILAMPVKAIEFWNDPETGLPHVIVVDEAGTALPKV
jgi:hypothetical protein